MGPLAIVNDIRGLSSEDSLSSADIGDRQIAACYEEHFGDVVSLKKENVLRIGFQNIGGFPKSRTKFQEEILRQGLCKLEFDVFGMAETNLDWRMCQEENKIPFRTQERWTHQHVSWTNNTTFPPTKIHQYGGTAHFSVNHAAHRVISKGSDPLKLADGYGHAIREEGTILYVYFLLIDLIHQLGLFRFTPSRMLTSTR